MDIRRGIIRAFDSGTYLADVQIVGSMATMLPGVPVAKQIGADLLTSGTRCGVLFFDETNPSDACVVFVYEGAPVPWITSALIKDGEIVEADLAFDPAIVDSTETISGLWTFDRNANAPFAVAVGSAVVSNLDADLLDGIQAASFLLAAFNNNKILRYSFVAATQHLIDYGPQLPGNDNTAAFIVFIAHRKDWTVPGDVSITIVVTSAQRGYASTSSTIVNFAKGHTVTVVDGVGSGSTGIRFDLSESLPAEAFVLAFGGTS